MVVSMYLWYRNSIKIYNRFKFDESIAWRTDTEEDELRRSEQMGVNNQEQSEENSNNNSPETKKKGKGFFSLFSSSKDKDQEPSSAISSTRSTGNTNSSSSGLYHSGHILIRVPKPSSLSPLSSQPSYAIEKRFAVVKNSDLIFYKDKMSFELHPEKPVRKRPVPLEDFALSVQTDTQPYSLILSPLDPEDDRAPIQFLCSAAADLALWVEVFSKATGQRE